MVKKISCVLKHHGEDYTKLPDFFDGLHQTTVDMRLKLMQALAKEKQKRQELEDDYEDLVTALKNSLISKGDELQ